MTTHLVCLLLLLATITLSAAKNLTRQENADLQQTCGRDARYRTKVLNGEGPLDYPFAAVVNVNGVLSATVISPRHVLLFNVFQMDKNGTVTLFNDTEITKDKDFLVGHCKIFPDWEFPEQANDLFQIKFAVEQFGAQAVSKVSRVVVLGGCDYELTTYKPMLLELAQDLTFDRTHGAICLPTPASEEEDKDDETVDSYSREGQEFTVFGMGPKGQALTSAQYVKKESCGKDFGWKNFVFCGSPVNESRGLCQGDFGGGAIANIDGRNVLLGIFAEGNTDCKADPQYHQDPEFIDISKYTKGICRQTGICPYHGIEEYETSTEDYETPIDDYETSTQEYEPSTEGVYVPPITTEEPSTETPESANTIETIIAETFEKMLLNCSASEHREEKPKEVHIHIHLDQNAQVHFN